MKQRTRLGLFGKIMLAMAIGIAVGFVLPEWGVRVLKTFEVFVTVLLKFMVPLVILGLVTAAIVEAKEPWFTAIDTSSKLLTYIKLSPFST